MMSGYSKFYTIKDGNIAKEIILGTTLSAMSIKYLLKTNRVFFRYPIHTSPLV